ncbi:ABC transporter substrate-binding protein [Gammaproteobacteria bacterium]
MIKSIIYGLFWLGVAVGALSSESAIGLERILISVPGPHALSYLPIDLIPKIGADRAEGVHLQILYTGGGSVALNNLITRNADFAVAGVPAVMSLGSNRGEIKIIAAVDDVPLFVLMVAATRKDQIKRIADLRGKVVGVNTSTSFSKTTSQQLMELLLQSDGVIINTVRIVPAGQNWIEQSALIISGAADAIMGDEPFASRLLKEGKVFFLANLADPETVKGIKGTQFLHAALETRTDIIAQAPEKVAQMVGMVQRSLAWITSHSPEQVVDVLNITDPQERASLLLSLGKYPNAFSRNGKFSTTQLQETELFFRSANNGNFPDFYLEGMINDHWVGRQP